MYSIKNSSDQSKTHTERMEKLKMRCLIQTENNCEFYQLYLQYSYMSCKDLCKWVTLHSWVVPVKLFYQLYLMIQSNSTTQMHKVIHICVSLCRIGALSYIASFIQTISKQVKEPNNTASKVKIEITKIIAAGERK